jgi:hypothetical protein
VILAVTATLTLFQNCSGFDTVGSSSQGSQGGGGGGNPPPPNNTPPPTNCPVSSNTPPTVTASAPSVIYNMGMGRDAGTQANISFPINVNSNDSNSAIVSAQCQTPNGARGLQINCVVQNPVRNGAFNITIQTDNDAECEQGPVTVQVRVVDSIVGANNTPIQACAGLNANNNNAPAIFTVNVQNRCLPTQRLNPDSLYQRGQLGTSVAIEGEWALAAAPEDATVAAQAGAGFLYRRQGSTWAQVQKLIPSGLPAQSRIETVALSSDMAALGAPTANGGRGRVWVFTRSGDLWSELKELTAPANAVSFGRSLAVNGGRVVVGAPGSNEGDGTLAGAAYLFSGAGINALTVLRPQGGTTARGQFGRSVAMSGGILAIGAPFNLNTATPRQEAVYVFDAGNGAFVQKITNADAAADYFGFSVSLDGGNLLVGSPYWDARQGRAHLFTRGTAFPGTVATATRTYVAADPTDGDVDSFGYSVAVRGARVLIGTPDRPEAVPKIGATYLFGTAAATQLFKIRARQADRGANSFGYSIGVSLDGWLMVGALNAESNLDIPDSGSVFFVALP